MILTDLLYIAIINVSNWKQYLLSDDIAFNCLSDLFSVFSIVNTWKSIRGQDVFLHFQHLHQGYFFKNLSYLSHLQWKHSTHKTSSNWPYPVSTEGVFQTKKKKASHAAKACAKEEILTNNTRYRMSPS